MQNDFTTGPQEPQDDHQAADATYPADCSVTALQDQPEARTRTLPAPRMPKLAEAFRGGINPEYFYTLHEFARILCVARNRTEQLRRTLLEDHRSDVAHIGCSVIFQGRLGVTVLKDLDMQ